MACGDAARRMRPRSFARAFAASLLTCALSRQNRQLLRLQPDSHILTLTVLYSLKGYFDRLFSLLKSISFLIVSISSR